MARPCHRGLIKKRPITCLSKMFTFRAQHRGAALSDNTAPKIFHVERQTTVFEQGRDFATLSRFLLECRTKINHPRHHVTTKYEMSRV